MQSRIEKKDGKTYLVTRKSSLSEFWREIEEEPKAETAPVESPVKPVKKKTARKKAAKKTTG